MERVATLSRAVRCAVIGFGRRQAELVAERLAEQKIDAIYASDLRRAWETAQIIAEKSGLQVIPEPRLRELKFGVLEGLTFDEAQKPNTRK